MYNLLVKQKQAEPLLLKTIRDFILMGILSLFFILPLAAQNKSTFAQDVENSPLLTLEQFLARAASNPFFEEILIEQLKMQYSEQLALPADDWIVSLKAAYSLSGAEESLVNGFEGGLSLSKLFNQSGTALSTGLSLSPGSGDGYASFYFSLAQPIGQNAFGRNNRHIVEFAGIENEIIEIQVLEAYETYLASLIVLYYNWYSNYSKLQAASNSLDTSKQLYEEMEKKFKYKIADKLDLNKSELQLLSKQESLLSSEYNFKERQSLINMAAGYEKDRQFRPILSSFRDLEQLDLNQTESQFLESGRSIEALKLLVKQSQLNHEITADLLLPSADFLANYSVSGQGYGFEQDSINHSLQLGIELNYAILSKKITAQAAIKEIDIKRKNLSADNKIIELGTDIDNLINEIETVANIIEISKAKLELNRAVEEGEKEDYQLGSSDLNFYIQAINSRDSEESRLTSYTVQLNLLVVEFLRITDSLVAEIQ